ncbi:hypothetical protein ACWDSJ_28035 [Nocardia sp. NPDC003482]
MPARATTLAAVANAIAASFPNSNSTIHWPEKGFSLILNADGQQIGVQTRTVLRAGGALKLADQVRHHADVAGIHRVLVVLSLLEPSHFQQMHNHFHRAESIHRFAIVGWDGPHDDAALRKALQYLTSDEPAEE